MPEFNSDDHFIYYCRQESLRRNGVAITVNKRVRNAVLGKLLLLQGRKLVSDVEHPNLDQEERDFCSARQAYAHVQQEEVTEERDLCPNSQEVS